MSVKIKFLISSFLLFAVVSFLAISSFNVKLIFGSIIYFVFTIAALKYFKEIMPIYILIFFLSPLFFFNLRIGLSNFERNWVVVPSTVFLILSTILGFLYWKFPFKSIPLLLIALISSWFLFFFEKFKDKMTYGVTKDEAIIFKNPKFNLFDSKGNIYSLNNSNKIFILDFWNTYCGPCYELLPIIDSIYKTIDTSKFEIMTVNIPINGDKKEDNYKVLNKYNYSFLNLFAENNSVVDSFGIKYYPTTIIIKGNNVIYRGDFLTGIEKFKELKQ